MKLRESRSGASYIKMERNGGKRNNNDKCRTRSKEQKDNEKQSVSKFKRTDT